MARPRNNGPQRRTAFLLPTALVVQMDRIVSEVNARRERISSRREVIEYLFERVDESRIIGALCRRGKMTAADLSARIAEVGIDAAEAEIATDEPAEPEDVEVVV